MAPKRLAKVIQPPSETESDEETSSEEAPTLKPTSSPVVDKNRTSNKSESSSQSGSEDEPETESESASKQGTGKEKHKSILVSPPAKPAASTGGKSRGKRLPTENEDVMDYKKYKKSEGGVSDSKKPFQRIWEEEDEIALLKGMVDFSSEEEADPCIDIGAFHDFVKKLFHLDFSKAQLTDKIRRLRKKYENNSGRSKNGKSPTFSELHEKRVFELSKKVWGEGGVSVKVAADKEVAGKKLKVPFSPPPVLRSGLSLGVTALTRLQQGLDEQLLGRAVELIEPSKRAELEKGWMVLHKEEIKLAGKKSELTMETARAIWEAYGVSSSN